MFFVSFFEEKEEFFCYEYLYVNNYSLDVEMVYVDYKENFFEYLER